MVDDVPTCIRPVPSGRADKADDDTEPGTGLRIPILSVIPDSCRRPVVLCPCSESRAGELETALVSMVRAIGNVRSFETRPTPLVVFGSSCVPVRRSLRLTGNGRSAPGMIA